MRARHAICHALILVSLPNLDSRGDDPKAVPPRPARAAKPAVVAAPSLNSVPATAPTLPPLPGDEAAPSASVSLDGSPIPAVAASPAISPGSLAEVKRAEMGIGARESALGKPSETDTPAVKVIRETLDRRKQLLKEWLAASQARGKAEHPDPSPEQVAAALKADLEKIRGMLDQAAKTPDALLPEAFGPVAPGSSKPPEARLAEMKEAIDTARTEVKARVAELETLRGEGSKSHSGDIAALRANRDKIHQSLSGLVAARKDRETAVTSAASAEARDLAGDRLINYEWECRVEAERLACAEAQINLATRRVELAVTQLQAKSSQVELDRKLLDVMEKRYASQSERQQSDLKQAVVKEETRAAQTDDVLERYRAKRSADLLEQEAQAVAYEKALATTRGNLSVDRQKALADETVTYFEERLKAPLNDGNVSPLDVLLLKNAFRRIGPLRASIVKGDLATVKSELTTYENALADAEVDLVNDDRDDRYDREALLDKLPEKRHHEAEVILDTLEARHHALLNRSRDVLQKLARRAEGTQSEINRRIRTLDEEYAFIRTHIFWVRDAEPIGLATLDHAGDEAVRVVRALAKLACEPWDRTLWGRVSPDFVVALVALVVLPWPLRLGQKAMDRLRLASPDPTMTPETAPSPVVG